MSCKPRQSLPTGAWSLTGARQHRRKMVRARHRGAHLLIGPRRAKPRGRPQAPDACASLTSVTRTTTHHRTPQHPTRRPCRRRVSLRHEQAPTQQNGRIDQMHSPPGAVRSPCHPRPGQRPRRGRQRSRAHRWANDQSAAPKAARWAANPHYLPHKAPPPPASRPSPTGRPTAGLDPGSPTTPGVPPADTSKENHGPSP